MKQLLKANHKGGIMKQIVAMMIAGVMLTGCYATTGTVSKPVSYTHLTLPTKA